MQKNTNYNGAEMRPNHDALQLRAAELADALVLNREGFQIEQAADMMDNLQLASNREFELDRLAKYSAEFSLVRQAMAAVNAGTYGECTDCGERIQAKRLQAIPWAIRCVSCQERSEATNGGQQTEDSWELLKPTN